MDTTKCGVSNNNSLLRFPVGIANINRVTSHGHFGVSNHRQIGTLLDSLLRLRKHKAPIDWFAAKEIHSPQMSHTAESGSCDNFMMKIYRTGNVKYMKIVI